MNIYDYSRIGTHKEIGVDEVVWDALKNGVDTISVISSGNYLNAILAEIKRRSVEDELDVVNLVNKTHDSLGLELVTKGILKNAHERERYIHDSNPNTGKVKDYTDFIPKALEREAEKMLESNPDYISLGIGSGKLFVVLYRKIKEKQADTKLIGILPKDENAVFNEGNFEFTSIATKLTSPYSCFKYEMLQAQSEGHILYEATDEDFRKANSLAKSKGYDSEISGSAGFVIDDEGIRRKYGIKNDSNILIVNTGCGYDIMKKICGD